MNDYNLLTGLNAQPPVAVSLSPFLEHAHDRQGRENLLAWMQNHGLKYQLQHMNVRTLIRQIELAIVMDRGI